MQDTTGPIIQAVDDRCVWRSRWNENWQGKPKYLEKICFIAILFTTDPTQPDLGLNPGHWDSCDMATHFLTCYVLAARSRKINNLKCFFCLIMVHETSSRTDNGSVTVSYKLIETSLSSTTVISI
jgi:hypothetical protein